MTFRQRNGMQSGFSYLELLIATVFIAMALPAALDAMSLSLRNGDQALTSESYYWALNAKMEMVSAQSYSNLDSAATAAGSINTPTTYSDPPGSIPRVLVYLSRYDGDNADADNDPFTGTDNRLLFIRVVVEQVSTMTLETLATL